jgi:uncharacterized peroxidase-related enzyme
MVIHYWRSPLKSVVWNTENPMPHIKLPEGLPGILGPMAFRPETAKPLNELAEVLLRGPGPLSLADRELIATYVSSQNDCFFCQTSHGSVAAYHLGGNEELVLDIKNGFEYADIPERLKALLAIAGKVQRSGKDVLPSDIERARQHGATDLEIHDTVLIAAMFCLANRYVDGLATFAPQDLDVYRQMGAQIAQHGYSSALEHVGAARSSAA